MSEVAINAPNLWRLETPGHPGWQRTAHADDPKKYFIVSTDSHANEPPDLLVAQKLVAREPLEPFRRHAVAATEVAFVGD